MFHNKYPLSWTFHRNTSRWPFNVHGLAENLQQEASFKEHLDLPVIPLPEAHFPNTSLQDVIESRFSCRRFLEESLKLADLATLLKSGYGIHNKLSIGDVEFLERTVPSAGGLYPLELYILVARVEGINSGVYHYVPLHHILEEIRPLTIPTSFIADLFMGQPYAAQASVIIILASVIERSLWKYEDRGYRYMLFEAGHVAQNINLAASALALGSLNLGGFFDSDLSNLLSLDSDKEVPLYGVAIGRPSDNARSELRQPIY
jgi:SagB-type dehydrogenase family enzyme